MIRSGSILVSLDLRMESMELPKYHEVEKPKKQLQQLLVDQQGAG